MDEKFLEQADSELAGWADAKDRLEHALENDEFSLYCQPILALKGPGGYPIAEVLVRLREEELALRPPGDFLPVFEHYGMMSQLDRWVVRHTLKRVASGSRIPQFSVNLSSQTLDDVSFPGFVADELANRRVSARSLLFEVDESDTLQRPQAVARFARAYRAIGGRLMIDGFGRRSVSFATIKELQVHSLKVDGSITRNVLTSEAAKTKMNALLRVSQALGFALVGEFIEEQDILLRLKALGVGYAQGFGICQPLPMENFSLARAL